MNLKLLTVITFIFTALNSSNVFAEVTPKRGQLDSRMRYIDYFEEQVYHINAAVGFNTHLKFDEGEVFEEWYSGDSQAYKLTHHKNYVSFKPIVEESETNILIITNKRAYNLQVHIHDENIYYGVHFKYPEQERIALLNEQIKKETRDLLDPENQTQKNNAYIGAGSDYIRPEIVFDNGTHTYFYFPERIDIPSIFRVRNNDTELLTQTTTVGNWIVVPRVQERWTLRLGLEVFCVRNVNFTLIQEDNKTNTISPLIERQEITE